MAVGASCASSAKVKVISSTRLDEPLVTTSGKTFVFWMMGWASVGRTILDR